VRLVLAALMIGAAGTGYVYLNQTPVPAAESKVAAGTPLFDWQSANETLAAVNSDVAADPNEPPLVVRDTIRNARTEITTVLDEFVRVNGNSDPATGPADIVAQADHPVADSTDDAVVPFATSDAIDEIRDTTGTGKADISTSESPAAPETPVLESTSDATTRKAPGSPSINDATMVTKTSTPKTSTAPARKPDVATKQPKSELLPGGKMPAKPPVAVVDPDWNEIAKTTNKVPIHTRRFGRQGIRTLIIAGLDGQDLIATRWNDELADVLAGRSDLLQTDEILILRAGNPDGLMKRMAPNANGVLINRNFPSRRYQFLSDNTAGPGPASEAETHAILQVMYSFRPRRVIHLTSTTGRSTALYNRAARETAMELQTQFQLEAQQLDVEFVPGSIEDFADGTLDAAVISLKLNSGKDWQQAWTKHLQSVLTAVHGQNPKNLRSVSGDDLVRTLEDVNATPIPNMNEVPDPPRKRQSGYEELPPPPR